MGNRIADLRCKEVVNICDGARLGFVCDVEVELNCGKVTALLVPGPCRFLGLFWRECDYLIPWSCIRRIGEDIILVDVVLDSAKTPRPRRWP
ncbi:MAG: YlmC/YmxH family sporulation protein [Ruminococcaceae bacterium]|nr:YlmC/YmxH family sporulation protein [Oscillospiraceae bacterium]